MNTSFPTNYSVTISPEMPGTGNWKIREYFLPLGYKPEAVGSHLVMRVKDGASDWIAHFSGNPAQATVWSMPDPDAMLVVAVDETYYLSVREPEKCIALGIYGATATPAVEQGIVVVTGFTGALVIDRNGVRWRTSDLYVDGTQVVSVDDKRVVFTGYDYTRPDGVGENISMNIRTGQPL